MITIRIKNETVESLDNDGSILKSDRADTDAATVIQDAVDRMPEGGRILLRAGKYILARSVVIDMPVTVTGEGRATEFIPAAGEFAFRVLYNDRCQRRCEASFGFPPRHSGFSPEAWRQEQDRIRREKIESRKAGKKFSRTRLHGVHISRLAIQGNGAGKGISLAALTESTFRDLWIMNTLDGAALYFEHEVMESVFENLHLSNCGSAENDEGTITIRSQRGDACNNLHFRSIYVIFPPYVGILIGSEGLPRDPRLIWFDNCMIHGWNYIADVAPYELVRVNKTDPFGVTFTNCRLTNCGKESAYVDVRGGRVTVETSVIGGGTGKYLLKAGPDAILTASRNMFHDIRKNTTVALLFADRAQVEFTGNRIAMNHCDPVLDMHSPKSARISDNTFEIGQHGMLQLSDTIEKPTGPVFVTGNMITGEKRDLQTDLASGASIVDRENVSL